MQTLHRSLRKAVSCLVTLLLTFAIFASSSAAPISDTFTYDANGNMISGSGLSFIYNDANQLVKIINESDSSTVAEYFYDANGQRVKKIEGGVTTYYIGDYVETRMNGSTVDNTSYYFANNERVARKDPDGSKFYYHSDHLGSTSVVTNEIGAQSEKVAYYPYGSLKERVGEGSTYLFTDQEFDDESGLYYYGARYYNPELTRFTQPDTVIQDEYNPQNLNRYAYVLNNPVKYTDPTGQLVLGTSNWVTKFHPHIHINHELIEKMFPGLFPSESQVHPFLEPVEPKSDTTTVSTDRPIVEFGAVSDLGTNWEEYYNPEFLNVPPQEFSSISTDRPIVEFRAVGDPKVHTASKQYEPYVDAMYNTRGELNHINAATYGFWLYVRELYKGVSSFSKSAEEK